MARNIPAGQFVPVVWVVPPPSVLLTGGAEQEKEGLDSASAAQQPPEHRCVTKTASVTNPTRGTLWAVLKKIFSIAARPTALSNVNRSTEVSFCIVHLRRVPLMTVRLER